jgi:hypothetical protein
MTPQEKQLKYTRRNLEQTLINLSKLHELDYSLTQVKTMPMVNLVYRIQSILIRFGCVPFTQAEIDSLIYH